MDELLSVARQVAGDVKGTVFDVVRGMRRREWRDAVRGELAVVPRALRSVPWLLRAKGDADLSLLRLALENAALDPFGLALEMGDERMTWRDLAQDTSRIAHVLASLGVRRGDVVALLGKNSPVYIAALLGISRLGATAALINSHVEGQPLAHAILVSKARVALVEAPMLDAVRARDDLRRGLAHIVGFRDGELEERMAKAPTTPFPRAPVPVTDDFVYIYTSGTTGLPKPCRVTHARALAAAAGFAHVAHQFRPGDKLYTVLPLYHSSALLLGLGPCLVTRTPMAMRESFSASSFWKDVVRYRATHMLYIGELCRYLVNTPPCDEERNHTLRVAVGNGLRADVWAEFARRFRIPTIREFYSATEAPGIIMNLAGKPGSVGRVPMRRLSPLRLVRYDVDRDEHVRGPDGFCIECGPGEVGELLIRLPLEARTALGDFRGYTDPEATRRKILENVFRPGDRWFRSGDLLRFDEDDWFYFVDRIGDTYRWKGENVSTAEVEEVLARAPGVRQVTVVGIHVSGMEGQCGLAAVVADASLDPRAFFAAAQELPSYAQPRFVRVMDRLDTTGTFKIRKSDLRADGVDPSKVKDALWLRTDEGYEPLTPARWSDVVAGHVRL